MGHLDEPGFDAAIAGCKQCGGHRFEVTTYIDRKLSLMLADPNDDGDWAHDGEKFIDGVVRVACATCKAVAFSSDDCPRCHRAGVLGEIERSTSKLGVPARCPKCKSTETAAIGFARATCFAGEGKPTTPVAVTAFGEPGFHLVAVACDACDWAEVAEGCPLCGNRAALRQRP